MINSAVEANQLQADEETKKLKVEIENLRSGAGESQQQISDENQRLKEEIDDLQNDA